MYKLPSKQRRRGYIHRRIRKRLRGTAGRPRLAVFRSLKHIYAQVTDDAEGRTLAAAGTLEKSLGDGDGDGGNVAAAKLVGKAIAERARKAGVEQVVFDRGGHEYHGRVQALAEAAREAGLKF